MYTIDAFDRDFSTDEDCKRFLVEVRWPNGVACPRCKSEERIYLLKSRPFHWVCKSGLESIEDGQPVTCHRRNGYRFSVITHTIFEDTKIAIRIWFKVAFLVMTAKKGISALQVHRVIFGEDSTHDYHTTWYMVMRWREAMKGDALPLAGIIEVDEMFHGGKERNKHRSKRQHVGTGGAGKVAVIGAIARKGMVVAQVVENTDAATLDGFVRKVVDQEKVELVATDEYRPYKMLGRGEIPMSHETVNHSAGEYVRGVVHTNSIESFWSLFKRGVMGSYHHVSKEYFAVVFERVFVALQQSEEPEYVCGLNPRRRQVAASGSTR
jgi:hypothetical protein